MSIIDKATHNYETVRVIGADGQPYRTTGNQDALARSLIGRSADQLFEIARKAGLKSKALEPNHGLNAGQVRMNLGNGLRALVKKGTPVRIDEGLVIKALDQKQPVLKTAPAVVRPIKAEAAKPEKSAPAERSKLEDLKANPTSTGTAAPAKPRASRGGRKAASSETAAA